VSPGKIFSCLGRLYFRDYAPGFGRSPGSKAAAEKDHKAPKAPTDLSSLDLRLGWRKGSELVIEATQS